MTDKTNIHSVSEEQIDTWVHEAEIGYDVDTLRKRGRGRPGRGSGPSQVVTIRFTEEEIAIIDERAKHLKMTRSQLIREAVLA